MKLQSTLLLRQLGSTMVLFMTLFFGVIRIAEGVEANPSTDQYTPVVASALRLAADPIFGTDGIYHVVYELELSNSYNAIASLQKIEVLDANHPSHVIATYTGDNLLRRLRLLSNSTVKTTEIETSGTRLFLIDLAFDLSKQQLPSHLLHRFNLLLKGEDATSPPSRISYTAAPLTINPDNGLVFGPPLTGKGWIAVNGCCESDGVHRNTALPINGGTYYAQRFAIDWIKMDDQGRLVHGDATKVSNYPSYGAPVLAIGDGVVISARSDLNDQVPPNLPARNTININNILGNYVILKLKPNVYAMYAHLQKNSVTVKPGEKVKRGKILGKVGNTGNTSAPHLHIHLTSDPGGLGSDGLPYRIDNFIVAGQIPNQERESFYEFKGEWKKYLLPSPSQRTNQFPLDFTIVDF